MDMKTSFETNYRDIGETELWKTLKGKVIEEGLTTDFLDGVGKVCEIGIILSKDIIRFFPNYTLHDITHIRNVCKWMTDLLGSRKNELSASEAALLVMSACCHDIGMSVSKEQEEKLLDNTKTHEWIEYFKSHLKDEEEYSKTKRISAKMLRNYIRVHHHNRIGTQISRQEWPQSLTQEGINRDNLIDLCKSHGESLNEINIPRGIKFDFRLCAVLLRLADILDFDSSRAPSKLFQHLGLESPEDFEHSISQMEWMKNRSGGFGQIHDGIIHFTASFASLQLEIEVKEYIEWVKRELITSSEFLSDYTSKWCNLELPHKIFSDNIERKGYKFGDFHLTMDQDRVLELLTGRNLYNDPGVFVRELLQNSIDAILTRKKLDPYFEKETGRIEIRTWIDHEGFSWFRIEDNGTGMDENIITNYFLKVGRSYYTSDDFKADKRHYGRGQDYNPISRFGIGILSCFMSDPENNKLEVSTKRYSHDPNISNTAIRLNVDGLHGYYYLAQEQEQDDNDAYFKPMHHPSVTNENYRSEVGTTICVRVNLYQLGNYHSFQKIVEKYVQFPDVTVEYFGPEGHKIFPTKSTLINAVNNLGVYNPKNEPMLYKHKLSEDQFNNLKQNMPNATWNESPSINIQYYPLNRLSISDNLNGIAIFADVSTSATNTAFVLDNVEYHSYIRCNLSNEHEINAIRVNFYPSYPSTLENKIDTLNRFIRDQDFVYDDSFTEDVYRFYSDYQNDDHWIKYMSNKHSVTKAQIVSKYNEIRNTVKQYKLSRDIVERYNKAKSSYSITISYDELLDFLTTEESNVFQLVKDSLSNVKDIMVKSDSQITLTAYNGVLADTSNLLGYSNSCLGIVLLLNGDYAPEVNIARNIISNVPLKTAFDLAQIKRHLKALSYPYGSEKEPFRTKSYLLLAEKEIIKLIEKFPECETVVKFNGKTVAELQKELESNEFVEIDKFKKDSVYDLLSLVILKKHFLVNIDPRSYYPKVSIGKDVIKTIDFPAQLFFSFINYKSTFGDINTYNEINYYNVDHPFSQWLIKNQTLLQYQVPGIYNSLLEMMVFSKNTTDILNFINSMLKQLKAFNSSFEITDDLFLKDSDFNT
ncbi:MAG: ATP-binding protein [Ruminococcus sp.]|nr:ATP-binding protein [Ruminococcus sp.]